MSPLAPISTPTPGTPADERREGLAKAARGFEAIFVRQMLSAARKADFGGDDALTGGQGTDTFRQMQDERFAEITAERGSFGLAKMIEAQLARELSPSRLREGSGEGLLPNPVQHALPQPLPHAGGKQMSPAQHMAGHS